MGPKITVITVVFNSVATIESTIKSVIEQTFLNFEYIIIDGGSTDGTVDVVKKYQDKISLWVSEQDNGIYDAMNKGVSLAKGKYIYFLGGDDIFFNCEVLYEISGFLLDDKSVYYGNVLFKKRNIIYDGKFNKFKIVTRNISHQSVFYPKQVFVSFSFNKNYKIYADYDLNLKLYGKSSFSFKYIPLTIALFNDCGASGSNVLDFNFEHDRLMIIKNNFPCWVYWYRILRSKFSKIVS